MEPKYVEMGARAKLTYEAFLKQLMQAKQAPKQPRQSPFGFTIKIKPNEIKPE